MICLRCLGGALPSAGASSRLAGQTVRRSLAQSQLGKSAQQTRSISLLTPKRPILPPSRTLSAPGVSADTSSTSTISSEQLDLLPKISSHPALQALQVRNGPRNTFNPSHVVRKRRHGFLSRIRTRKGRNTLMRRRQKQRKTMSH